jgi:hypothetical protein
VPLVRRSASTARPCRQTVLQIANHSHPVPDKADIGSPKYLGIWFRVDGQHVGCGLESGRMVEATTRRNGDVQMWADRQPGDSDLSTSRQPTTVSDFRVAPITAQRRWRNGSSSDSRPGEGLDRPRLRWTRRPARFDRHRCALGSAAGSLGYMGLSGEPFHKDFSDSRGFA